MQANAIAIVTTITERFLFILLTSHTLCTSCLVTKFDCLSAIAARYSAIRAVTAMTFAIWQRVALPPDWKLPESPMPVMMPLALQ